MIVNMTQKKIK